MDILPLQVWHFHPIPSFKSPLEHSTIGVLQLITQTKVAITLCHSGQNISCPEKCCNPRYPSEHNGSYFLISSYLSEYFEDIPILFFVCLYGTLHCTNNTHLHIAHSPTRSSPAPPSSPPPAPPSSPPLFLLLPLLLLSLSLPLHLVLPSPPPSSLLLLSSVFLFLFCPSQQNNQIL